MFTFNCASSHGSRTYINVYAFVPIKEYAFEVQLLAPTEIMEFFEQSGANKF